MVAKSSSAGIHELVTMKKGSGTSSPTVVGKKTSNPKGKSNKKDKNIQKEAVNKINDNTGKSKVSNKSKGRMLQTEDGPAASKKEESKKRKSQDTEKKIKTLRSGKSRDSSRNEISQRKLKSEGILSAYSPRSLDDEDDLDFSAIEQKIFEGFPQGKRSEKRDSLIKDKTKKDVQKVSLSSSKGDDKRSMTNKEKHALEKKNKLENGQMTKSNVGKRESQNMATLSKCSKLKDSNKGKTKTLVSNTRKKNKTGLKKKSTGAASDSGMSDWEEVDEMEGVDEVKELLSGSHIPKASEGVQIELDAPDLLWGIRKRKKRTEEEMIEDYLRKSVNKSIKEVYENMHKVHLLCLFAHGRYVNQILNSDILLGAALSIITDKKAYPPKRLDMDYLEKFVNWFSRKITVKLEGIEVDYWNHPLQKILCKRFETKMAHSNREFVFMFVIVCRALGMNVRLVLSLQPMKWKPGTEVLIKPSKKEKSKDIFSEPSCSQEPEDIKEKLTVKDNRMEKDKSNRKMLSSDSDHEVKKKKCSDIKKSRKRERKIQKRNSLSDDGDSDFDPKLNTHKGQRSRSGQMQRNSKKRKRTEEIDNTDKRKDNEKVGELEGKRRKAEPLLEWVEIFIEEEEKWICVDVTQAKIHCVGEIEVRIPAASAYITAFSANLAVKDVTRRYISSWLSNENKIRCCSRWWEKTLRPFKGHRTQIDKAEEEEMDQNLQQQPLPRTIGEYKKHPLYALQRHLLKFEAIYPPDVSPVGFIKNEPVYPRDSVFTLCSRDTWMKEAKSVRVGEEAYKIVKARPKWDRNICQVIKDKPLELFGGWQVEDYEPPVASGGKVPRNEYGNVELFKPSMLPKGCVHIPISGLNRIARKLNIDCAPAMVGFDFHSGWTHPVYDGYVVCEEFRETLVDAWNQEQAEQAKRAEEKREKRIYDNWKRLIQGILVRERVRKKYGDVSTSDEEREHKKEKKKTTKKKIRQEDIDAVRPTLITHQVKNLKIDLSSNVVEMAKKSRKGTMKTKNVKRINMEEKMETNKNVKTDLIDSESASDEEEKKAKIRAILKWESKAAASNPDLSDDSDIEKESTPSSSAHTAQFSNPFHNSIIKSHVKKHEAAKSKFGKRRKESSGENLSDSEESGTNDSSRSTAPEPDTKSDPGSRRTSRRSAKQKIRTYKESEECSDEDISIDESDCDDKSYDPKTERSRNQVFNLSEGSDLD